ncbi:MAG: hypothetical protein JST40_02730 [Armatimonadetes bacterium]|nr:hypothetical protein [Armatimonadota bacterium]
MRKRRTLNAVAALLALFLVGLVVVRVIERSYQNRAVFAQRVQLDRTADDLFGDKNSYIEIGGPEYFVVDDQRAFLDGITTRGARKLDDEYLREHKIYPLQMQSVRFVAKWVNIALGALAFVSIGILLWAANRTPKFKVDPVTDAPEP